MVRVPFNRTLDATVPKSLQSEYQRYSHELSKDPNYGKARSSREAKRRLYYENKRKQVKSSNLEKSFDKQK